MNDESLSNFTGETEENQGSIEAERSISRPRFDASTPRKQFRSVV